MGRNRNFEKDLIGLKFKRNVYGPTDWTAIVVEVLLTWSSVKNGYAPRILVKSEKGNLYNINEIVFLNFN